jgi:hypothetical protein
MNNIKKIIVLSAVALIIAGTGTAVRGEDGYTIAFVAGEVTVTMGGNTHRAAVNEVLAENALIATGSGSMADISLAGKGLMRVQENTKVSVASLKQGGTEGGMDMLYGQVMVIMSKLFKGSTYELKTSTQVASIRGTVFQVSGDENRSQLDVFSGKVMVNPVVNGIIQQQISELVSDNQSLTLDKIIVLDIIAKKRKIKLAAVRREIREALMKQVMQIDESPHSRKLNEDLKAEIRARVMEIRREMKEKNLDRKSLREKMKEEKKKIRERMEEQKKQ